MSKVFEHDKTIEPCDEVLSHNCPQWQRITCQAESNPGVVFGKPFKQNEDRPVAHKSPDLRGTGFSAEFRFPKHWG